MKARTVGCVLGAALLAFALPAAADECAGDPGDGRAKLTVRVGAVRAAKGQVAVTVYPDDKRRFLAPKGKLLRVRTRAMAPATTACFWLPAGAYAVAVYHDADGDRDFDRTLVGLPAEGFGFSNNPPTKTGLPSFASARFQLPAAGRTLDVGMRYLKE